MKTYNELKQVLHDRMNNFEGLFFAFSNEQLREGMQKLGIKDTKEIVSIGAGGFVLKSRVQAFKDTIEQNDKDLAEFLSNRTGLLDALVYELGNHEYCITYDETDALRALDLELDTIAPDVLREAKEKYLEGVNW